MPCKGDAVSVNWIQDDVALRESVASWESIIGGLRIATKDVTSG